MSEFKKIDTLLQALDCDQTLKALLQEMKETLESMYNWLQNIEEEISKER